MLIAEGIICVIILGRCDDTWFVDTIVNTSIAIIRTLQLRNCWFAIYLKGHLKTDSGEIRYTEPSQRSFSRSRSCQRSKVILKVTDQFLGENVILNVKSRFLGNLKVKGHFKVKAKCQDWLSNGQFVCDWNYPTHNSDVFPEITEYFFLRKHEKFPKRSSRTTTTREKIIVKENALCCVIFSQIMPPSTNNVSYNFYRSYYVSCSFYTRFLFFLQQNILFFQDSLFLFFCHLGRQ